ncbi:MAG: BamA/TamA family outer membrane protein, partial [Bacteroidales bacterium]|nr:BamA/TamA family outer membrane protein [Bacteroidales bacterium]
MPEGSYRLVSNKVAFEEKAGVSASDVSPYIRQQPNSSLIFGWSPGLSIYNWSDGSGEGINKFWEKVGSKPVVFDPALVASSCRNIASHLETLGYYGSVVTPEISYKGRLAEVKYVVRPGKRYRIDRIVFDVPDGSFGEAFRADSANVTVREGDYLSEKALEAETVRGSAVFRDQGYYDFNKNHYFFEADTLTPVTTLHYRIRGYARGENSSQDHPIRQYRIGRVNIMHPAEIPFKESLLRDYNTIRPGDLYSERMVNDTYARLSSLKLFNNVNIEMRPTDSTTVDCDIRLSGADLVGVKFNVEASTNASGLLGFSPQLSFYHKNLFHGGEWLNLGFTGNWQWMPHDNVHSTEFGVTSSLSFPRLLGYPLSRIRGEYIPRTEIKASFNYQNRPEFRRSMASLGYGYTGQAGRNLYYQFYPLQLSLARLFSVSEEFKHTLVSYPYLWDTFEDHLDAGVGGMVYYTTDPDVVPRSAYHYERLSLDLSGNLLSLLNPLLPTSDEMSPPQHTIFGLPYKQYVRTELDLGKVFRFGWEDNQALALHLATGIGWAYGNSTALPFEKQFYCGGANSMRGWQARTLGPGSEQMNPAFSLPSQTGNFKMEADVEYRFPSFWKLEWALFAEVGNVWQLGGGQALDLPGSLAADWGAGLRVNLDFILIRLDAGFRLHDPADAPVLKGIVKFAHQSRDTNAVKSHTVSPSVKNPKEESEIKRE